MIPDLFTSLLLVRSILVNMMFVIHVGWLLDQINAKNCNSIGTFQQNKNIAIGLINEFCDVSDNCIDRAIQFSKTFLTI